MSGAPPASPTPGPRSPPPPTLWVSSWLYSSSSAFHPVVFHDFPDRLGHDPRQLVAPRVALLPVENHAPRRQVDRNVGRVSGQDEHRLGERVRDPQFIQ